MEMFIPIVYYNTKTVIRGVFMEISKDEFVKNILKAQAKEDVGENRNIRQQ